MGQAKQRGLLVSRIAQAKQQKLDGERITIQKVRRRL